MSSPPLGNMLASELPSQPANVYLRSERTALDSNTATAEFSLTTPSQRQSNLSSRTTLPGTLREELYANEKVKGVFWQGPVEDHIERVTRLGKLNTMVVEAPDFSDPDGMKVRRAKRLMKVRKTAFQFCIFGLK